VEVGGGIVPEVPAHSSTGLAGCRAIKSREALKKRSSAAREELLQTRFARRHHAIVIPRERGPQHRREGAHPGFVDADPPGVFDGGAVGGGFEAPDAFAFQFAAGFGADAFEAVDFDHVRVDIDVVGQAAGPVEAVARADAGGVTGGEFLDAGDVGPPARPAGRVVEHVPHALDRCRNAPVADQHEIARVAHGCLRYAACATIAAPRQA